MAADQNETTPVLKFEYVNWKSERAVRNIRPVKVWFGSTKWHPVEQWLLKAFDLDKQAERDFSLKEIVKFL
ncbi:hypothetical protein KJ596_02400 [Patescibacteria group bacterium]|nr:hypothetical protein [Patescibacteria group bacterium]MBU1868642.1 hypothetical protein [Patescibacteria group bacterium]